MLSGDSRDAKYGETRPRNAVTAAIVDADIFGIPFVPSCANMITRIDRVEVESQERLEMMASGCRRLHRSRIVRGTAAVVIADRGEEGKVA